MASKDIYKPASGKKERKKENSFPKLSKHLMNALRGAYCSGLQC